MQFSPYLIFQIRHIIVPDIHRSRIPHNKNTRTQRFCGGRGVLIGD